MSAQFWERISLLLGSHCLLLQWNIVLQTMAGKDLSYRGEPVFVNEDYLVSMQTVVSGFVL